jgi:hypothetical protein
MIGVSKWLRVGIVVLAATFVSAGTFAGSDQSGPLAVSVCDILRDPPHYQSQKLAVKAEVFADGMHGSMLTDSRCSGKGLILTQAKDEQEKTVQKLERYIFEGYPGTGRGKTISGVFIGMLKWTRFPMSNLEGFGFEIQTIQDLKLTMPSEYGQPPRVDLPPAY